MAGKIVRQGVLPTPPVAIASGCTAGDAITFSAGAWNRAAAATATRVFVAANDAPAGGKTILYAAAIVEGFAGLTPGTAMALADGGGYDQAGAKKCGIALTADTAYIGPDLIPTTA